jgi:hypothetical protein
MQQQDILPIGGIPFADLYDIAHTSALYTDQTTACIPCEGDVNFVLRQYKPLPPEPVPCVFGWTQRETQRAWSALASSADGNILYAGDGSSGPGLIYKSINSGVSWTSTSAPSKEWSSIATSTDGVKVVAVNSPQGITSGNIYTSVNSGVTWVLASAPTSQDWTSVASSSDGVKLVACNIFSGGSLGEIYTSIDSGTNWVFNSSAPASSQWTCVASSANGDNLVACRGTFGTDSIYTSIDSGANWNLSPFSSSGLFKSVASSSSGEIVYAGDSNGVWKSTNYGVNWAPSLSLVGDFTSIATSTDGVKVVAVDYGGGVYRSTNSGATWVQQSSLSPTAEWQEATSSADGEKLAVAGFTTFIYTFACT